MMMAYVHLRHCSVGVWQWHLWYMQCKPPYMQQCSCGCPMSIEHDVITRHSVCLYDHVVVASHTCHLCSTLYCARTQKYTVCTFMQIIMLDIRTYSMRSHGALFSNYIVNSTLPQFIFILSVLCNGIMKRYLITCVNPSTIIQLWYYPQRLGMISFNIHLFMSPA